MALPLSAITAHLTPEQLRVAAWYWFDARDQHEIAEWLGISRQAVGKQLNTIRRTLTRLGIPLPHRLPEQDAPTQPMRNVPAKLIAQL